MAGQRRNLRRRYGAKPRPAYRRAGLDRYALVQGWLVAFDAWFVLPGREHHRHGDPARLGRPGLLGLGADGQRFHAALPGAPFARGALPSSAIAGTAAGLGIAAMIPDVGIHDGNSHSTEVSGDPQQL
ncbi:MAG: hypothetical protein ABWX72_10370 [Arthrobacter sp.]